MPTERDARPMNILLLGSGGREHALAWKIAASPLVEKLYCAPGNAGIAQECERDRARHRRPRGGDRVLPRADIGFVVVGPEAPLCAGIVDDLAAAGIKAFGPSKAAARLEGSKGFTKDLCKANNIPTAAYERFTARRPPRLTSARRARRSSSRPTGSRPARAWWWRRRSTKRKPAIDMMFGGGLGDAGAEVVVEEFLSGEEASFFALCDGEIAIPLVAAQDHKRVVRRRPGPQHRRHGRLFAGAGHDAGDDPPHHGRDRAADGAGDEGDGRALQGRAVRRPDDHRQRTEADRVQRPLRRSGMPGADAAADVGSRAGAAGRRATAC